MKKTIAELNAARIAKLEAIRQAQKEKYLSNTADCGRFGRVHEMDCTPSLSSKSTVASANTRDNYIRVMADDEKIIQCALECKINGGRVDTLFTDEYTVGKCFHGTKYVAYKYFMTIKHKAGKHTEAWEEYRELPVLIIPKDVFVTALLSDKSFLKAVNHNGVQDGIAIQASSKKWYERLKAYAENFPDLVFEKDKVWESWQFDGVEL